MRGNPSNLRGIGGVGWRAGRDQVSRYLAAKAETPGQEAGEEVLAPADHAGKAPAQPSHVARGSGCPGKWGLAGGKRRTSGAGWGLRVGKPAPRAGHLPGLPSLRSSWDILPPLAGGAGQRTLGEAPARLHLLRPPSGSCRVLPPRGTSSAAPSLLPPRRRASLQPMPPASPALYPCNF